MINEADPEFTAKPLDTIKKYWNSLPAGVYTMEIRCGSFYGALVQKLESATHGAVLVIGYSVQDTGFFVATKTNDNWSQ